MWTEEINIFIARSEPLLYYSKKGGAKQLKT